MAYIINYNERKPYRDFYMNIDKPIKSSNLQDFLKKTEEHTQANSDEITLNVGGSLDNLKKENYEPKRKIGLGCLSLKETETYFSNSDSISRNTHIFVKQILIRYYSDNPELFNDYVYIKGTKKPKIKYREHKGIITTNPEFKKLNEFIINLLAGRENLDEYLDELDKFYKIPTQFKKFLSQLKSAKKWMDGIDMKSDEERIIVANNILNQYELTFDEVQNEVKVARETNLHSTDNSWPYHIQNELMDYIYNIENKSISKESQQKVEKVIIEFCTEILDGYLRDWNMEPDESNMARVFGWISKSMKVSSVNNREKAIEGGNKYLASYLVKNEINDIWKKEISFQEKVETLNHYLKNKCHITKCFKRLHIYIKNHIIISSNFYPLMLKYENNTKLTKDDYSLLKLHTLFDNACSKLYPSWGKWSGKLLKDCQNDSKKLLKDIIYDTLIFDEPNRNWYDEVVGELIYKKIDKQNNWVTVSLIDRVLGYSSFYHTEKGGITDIVSQFKETDTHLRSAEHWVPKSKDNVFGMYAGNLYYLDRVTNKHFRDYDIDSKLKKGFSELKTTLPIIYGDNIESLKESIKSLVHTKEWKKTFTKDMTNQDFLNEIKKSNNSEETNLLFNLRLSQLKEAIKTLHGTK